MWIPAFFLEGPEAHAARGRDGRQEGRGCGYYHLHRNLNKTLLHNICRSMFNVQCSMFNVLVLVHAATGVTATASVVTSGFCVCPTASRSTSSTATTAPSATRPKMPGNDRVTKMTDSSECLYLGIFPEMTNPTLCFITWDFS